MRTGEGGDPGGSRVLRLTPNLDPTSLSLTLNEGYLLSRIDGTTPWATLRQIGGMPVREVDRCLERWLAEGWIQVVGRGEIGAPEPPTSPKRAEGTGSVAKVDPSLDMDPEIQKEILAFAADLDRPYHEILGVAADADTRTIKKAYFGKSKRFHPDRYFRRNIGPFAPLVERCFKRLLEAYELLSDPATRAEVEREQASRRAPAAAPEGTSPSRASSLEARRRLRERFGGMAAQRRVREDRRRKAKTFFESGMAAFQQERWLEAAGSVRLAIAFDPQNEIYREEFASVQRRAHEERAKQLVRQGENALSMRDYGEALDLLEEAFHFRPYDAELAIRAARIAWQGCNELRRAKELAGSACELEPENGTIRRVLGQIFKAAGLAANARRELEAALRIDPKDTEARQELRSL
jgi:curved DNA-binding protein CbpA